ncbi:MAG TPA: hypothetical protein VMT55_06455 [Candidatus Sulfotelmatobacter sp.]|nr:hypothetical protein [Candidatus Sulfotelmatobacter sp.]
MIKLNCPICDWPIELTEQIKHGHRITCPNCFAQLGAFKHNGKFTLACALCREPLFDADNCAECDYRKADKKKFLEEGRL